MNERRKWIPSLLGTRTSILLKYFFRPSTMSPHLQSHVSVLDIPDENVSSHPTSRSELQNVPALNNSSDSNSLTITTATEKSDHDTKSLPERQHPIPPESEKDSSYLGKIRLSVLFFSLCLSTLMISMHKTVVIPAMYSSLVHYNLILVHG